jgi:plasmid stability protein
MIDEAMEYTFEFDALAIVRARSEAEAREILTAMVAAADLTGGTAGGLAILDNYTIYDDEENEVHPDDLPRAEEG